jgi:hypothetical protein
VQNEVANTRIAFNSSSQAEVTSPKLSVFHSARALIFGL